MWKRECGFSRRGAGNNEIYQTEKGQMRRYYENYARKGPYRTLFSRRNTGRPDSEQGVFVARHH